ncbi:MAG: helix-hairpin-helix domain-containing protein [Thermoguttaceae bacterium]|jgi:hypothetical protein
MNVRLLRNSICGAALVCAVASYSAIAPNIWAADAKADVSAKAAKPAKIDLNTASEKQLQELPGIGEAYSKKIVAARPLKTIKELSKLGIPAPTITKITPLVTVSVTRPGGKLTPPKKGLVWVNKDTKIYHKEGSMWYGNTKEGSWMTEAQAIKAGNKAAE